MTRDEYVRWGATSNALRGTQLKQSRLDDDAVRYVRKNPSGLTAKELAQRFSVHYRTIEKVRAFETWIHVR